MKYPQIFASPFLVSVLVVALAGASGCTPAKDGAGSDDPAGGGSGASQGGGQSGGSGEGRAGSGGTGGSGGSTGPGSAGSGGAAGSGAGSAGMGGGAGGSADAGASAPDGAPIDPPAVAPDPGKTGGEPPEVATPPQTDLAKHRFSKTLTLNTTSSGAGVNADIANFPVAVVLDEQNFDFSQAQRWGQDVRFSTMEGTLLPYSIELWDADAKKAALWVRVDVEGNSNSQAMVLHWGNPEAVSAANSKAVFDKDSGFLGVYHLNQDGNIEENGYQDASWNEVHGTGVRMSAGSLEQGRVGPATKFNNAGGGGANVQWVKVDGPKVVSDFNGDAHPISATIWVNAESWRGYYETLFSKGDRSWTLQRDYQGRMEACQHVGYHACAITARPTTGEWVHWMLVQKRGSLVIYRNGSRAAGTGGNARYGDHAFGIGNQTQYNMGNDWKRGFHGLIDEVRVMNVEKNADWAKLDYESQKPDSKFLTFGPTQTK